MQVNLSIFTVTGRIIKRIHQQVISPGYRIDEIYWDGLDDYGDKIGKGVYIYRLSVTASDGSVVDKFEKLYILR